MDEQLTSRSAADLIAMVKAREILASGPVSSERKFLLKENLSLFRRAIEALESQAADEDGDQSSNGGNDGSKPDPSADKGSSFFNYFF